MEFTKSDIVSAFRFDRTAEGFVRTLYSVAYNLLIRFLFPLRVKDINFSFKLFKREMLDKFVLESEASFMLACIWRWWKSKPCCRRRRCRPLLIKQDVFPAQKANSSNSRAAGANKLGRSQARNRRPDRALSTDRAKALPSRQPPAPSHVPACLPDRDPPDPWDGSSLDSQLCWPLAKMARRPNGTMVPAAGFEFGVFVGARIVIRLAF